ncbi:MAG: hypothetical protein SRB1_02518 [Desulfobacteraceae bacterium Eth-SRB1]|nr:MAG: hypothetical protein SRB1_02518 [Desulfobacteraceae bacterium Eth-SRB1]
MKRIISLIIFFMVSLTVLIMFPVVALSETVGTFTYVKGRVDITAPGMKAVPAHKGDDVNVGDIIRTKSNSKAEIALIDGSILRFAQKSRVKINEYMVEKKQTRGILKLFRGKIQNIVKKTAAKTFGRKTQNLYEVQTPTAVCGVRGTNFFVFHQRNTSGAIFKKGSGYGYSVNRPDVVKTIKAGQAMIVISPDQPPVIKPATDIELQQHTEDTAPSEEEEEAEEEEEEKVEAVEEEAEAEEEEAVEEEEVAEEEAPAEEEAAVEEEAPVEEGEVAEEAPAEEIETAEEAPVEEAPAEEAAPGPEEAGEAPLPAAEEQAVPSEAAPESVSTAPEPATELSVETDTGFISGSSADVDLGTAGGGIADSPVIETGDIDPTTENLEPYIPPETEVDTTPPVITIASAASPETDNLTAVNLDLSSNETVTYSCNLDDATVTTTSFSGLGEGEHIFEYTATDEAGNTSSDTLPFDLHPYALTGSVSGTGSTIEGSADGDISAVANQNWGGWILELEGTYTGAHSSSWEMTAGGQTLDSSANTNGYWIETINGTEGASNFTYLTHTTLGTGTGAVDATFNDGTWQATDSGIGTLTETPLAFGGDIDGAYYYYRSDYDGMECYDYSIEGGIGVIDSPFELPGIPVETRLIGKTYPSAYTTWWTNISGNDYVETENQWSGWIGGVTHDNTVKGMINGLYIDSSGYAGILSGLFTGPHYPEIEMWEANGTLTADKKSLTADYDVGSDLSSYTNSGNPDGDIYGTFNGYGFINAGDSLEAAETTWLTNPQTNKDEPWGIYKLELGGYYDNPDSTSTFSIVCGGGYWKNNWNDYWIAHIEEGFWNPDHTIEGNAIEGRYLTNTALGLITGKIFGSYDTYSTGAWEALASGTFSEQELAFSGLIESASDLNDGPDWGLYAGREDDGDYYFETCDDVEALAGGITSPWMWDGIAWQTQTVNVAYMGGSCSGVDDPYPLLWSSNIYSFNAIDENRTTYDGGAFNGFIGGVLNDGLIDGRIVSLYMDPGGNAGYITGNLTGTYYPELYKNYKAMLDADGIWAATMMSPDSGINPADFCDEVRTDTSIHANLSGDFSGNGYISGAEHCEGSFCYGWTRYIDGWNWGIYDIVLNGYDEGYDNPNGATTWSAKTGGSADFGTYEGDDDYLLDNGYWLADITAGAWDENKISGSLSNGKFLTSVKMGEIRGDIIGFYDDSGHWAATSLGVYEGEPLAFSGYWEGASLYYNNNGNMDWAGEEYGIIGGLSAPWDGPAEFLAMGEYYHEDGLEGKDHYLWNSEIYAFGISDEGETEAFMGFTGGIWENGAMEGTAVALYLNMVNMDLEDESVTAGYVKGDVSGLYYPELEMWMAEGTLTPSGTQIYSDYDSIDAGYGYISSRLSGNFDESAGFILGNGGCEDEYEWLMNIFYIVDYSTEAAPLCGIYDLKLGYENVYNGKPAGDTTWSARVGGNMELEYVADSYGYWLADAGGDWTGEGEITGSLVGTFLTSTHTGSIGGSFYGINAVEEGESGTWIGESLGTFTGDPLTFSSSFGGDTYRTVGGTLYAGSFGRRVTTTGDPYYDARYDYDYFVSDEDVLLYGENWEDYYESDSESGDIYLPDGTRVGIIEDDFLTFTRGSWTVGAYDSNSAYFSEPPDDGGTWERHWYEERSSFCLANSGAISGIMGGTGDLWSATDSNPAGISLMGMYNPTDGDYNKPSIFGFSIQSSDITTGAYAGYLSGITDNMNGDIYAVYVDPSQNAGILKGGFSGTVYPDLEMWNASGTVSPVTTTIQSTGILPADLSTNLDRGTIAGWLSGDFGDSNSEIFSELGWGETLSLSGEGLGVYRLMFGYNNCFYNPDSSTTWSARASGYTDTGIWLTDEINGTFENSGSGAFASSYTGNFLTLADYGQLAGEITGTYAYDVESTNGGWQAVSSGYWESSEKLKFNGILDGADLTRMMEQYEGQWDDGTPEGSHYHYSYETGVEAGWSVEYDGTKTTHINYNADGTTETWVDDNGALSYSEGTWSVDLGLYEEYLKDGASVTGEVLRNENPTYNLRGRGWLDGFMGGLDDLWTASAGDKANIRFIGEYDAWYDEVLPSVFSMGIKSYNPYDGSCTIWNQDDNSQNGAYYGYMGGRTLANNTLEGGMLALYLDKSGNMGFLKGSFDGDIYPDAEMWDGTGGIYPVEIVQATGFNASDFHPDSGGLIRQTYLEGSAEFHGEFFNASTGLFGGDIHRRYGRKKSAAVKTTGTLQIGGQFYNQYFSVTSTIYGGTYTEFDGNTSDHWYLPFSFDDGTTKRKCYLLSSSDAAGSWSDNMISGKGVGAWVNLDEVVTGVCGADLKGTFNPLNATWQTAAMWAGIDTRTFLAMTDTDLGKDKLAQLNIPCIEVGRTNLTGSADGMTVNMNDTTFFAYSNGAAPRIWATGDVSGSYTSDPSVGTSVPLIGTSGNINANFDVQKWDTNQWAAGVTGSGTVADHDINMSGAAAGQYSSNNFSGTGAGVALPGISELPSPPGSP